MKTKAVLSAVMMVLCGGFASGQVWNGNLVFTNQAEIDNFAFFSYTSVNGNLEIIDAADNQHNITNLAGLAGLTAVTGNVVVMNNNVLPNTVYLNLTSVGSLRISGNPLLTTINGLPITNSPSAIRVESNNALTSITAFNSITNAGKLVIQNNPLLTNISGFSNLTKVNDSLLIAFSNGITQLGVLSRLSEAGSLVIQNNSQLANLDGLTALVKVRDLDVSYNPALANINGLINLTSAVLIIIYQNPALLNVSGINNVFIADFGSLYIHNNNALQNVVGPAGLVRVGILSIQQNAALTGISGFNSLKNVFALDIIQNPALTNVSGFAVLDSISASFRLQQNVSLLTLNAFQSLRHISGSYTNTNNYVLASIAPMPLLDSISGGFRLASDSMITNMDFVPNLRSVRNDIVIQSCKRLANLNGLSNLMFIRQGSLLLDSCPQLTSLVGLDGLTRISESLWLLRLGIVSFNGLQNITRVGFSLRIDNNLQLTSTNELIKLDTVASTIVITSNPLISDLNGLRNLRRTQGITIGANASLAQFCGLYQVLAGSNPPNVFIAQNLVNPTAQEIVNAGPCSAVQLPVTLQSFTVRCYQNRVMADWVTTNETGSSHYVLQRSIDGIAWTNQGMIQAAGNSGVERKYHIIDDVPLPDAMYRLAQFDVDGKVHYSTVERGGCALQDELRVWPNPATDEVIVSIRSSTSSMGLIRVLDSKGVVLLSRKVALLRGLNKFAIGVMHFAGGVYTLQVQNAGVVSGNLIFVKQ